VSCTFLLLKVCFLTTRQPSLHGCHGSGGSCFARRGLYLRSCDLFHFSLFLSQGSAVCLGERTGRQDHEGPITDRHVCVPSEFSAEGPRVTRLQISVISRIQAQPENSIFTHKHLNFYLEHTHKWKRSQRRGVVIQAPTALAGNQFDTRPRYWL
jgi:hypothetical protein